MWAALHRGSLRVDKYLKLDWCASILEGDTYYRRESLLSEFVFSFSCVHPPALWV